MNFLARIWEFFDRLIGRRETWFTEVGEDIPAVPKPRRVYLIGDADAPWAAAFLCPCGCKELIQLSLIRHDNPSWIASGRPGSKASLHPSIWRIRGCRSHFFIKEGRVIWAREEHPDHRISLKERRLADGA